VTVKNSKRASLTALSPLARHRMIKHIQGVQKLKRKHLKSDSMA